MDLNDAQIIYFANKVLLSCPEFSYFSVTEVCETIPEYDNQSSIKVRAALLSLKYADISPSGSEFLTLNDLGRKVRKAGGHFTYHKLTDSDAEEEKRNNNNNSKYAKYSVLIGFATVIVAIIFGWLQYSAVFDQNKKIEELEKKVQMLENIQSE